MVSELATEQAQEKLKKEPHKSPPPPPKPAGIETHPVGDHRRLRGHGDGQPLGLKGGARGCCNISHRLRGETSCQDDEMAQKEHGGPKERHYGAAWLCVS